MKIPLPTAHLLRASQSSSRTRPLLTIGIRREDPARIWERRCPLTPDAVSHLVKDLNVEVHVQPCDRRVFHIDKFIEAGAKPRESLQDAHIILGIKETPLLELITSPIYSPNSAPDGVPFKTPRTHFMFSHTAKGQPYNTPLLSRFLREDPGRCRPEDPNLLPRLIDYEMLTDGEKRTVGFGWFAGVAGVFESLSAMAHSHLEIGIATPFLYTPRPHTLPSLDALRKALRSIGNIIASEGTPKKLGPFVIGLTGSGNVSKGCLSILSELPIEKVKVEDLHALVVNPQTSLRKIYLVHALPQDYLTGVTDGKPYEREHYYASPQCYKSEFAAKVAPYLTLFLNGTGWSPRFPRLMTNDQLSVALHRAQTFGGARFTNIGDISCDVEGGLQFLERSSTLSEPFYKIRPPTLSPHLPSVQMMAVDILPTAIPLDASRAFSDAVLPYVETAIQAYGKGASRSSMEPLERATVAKNGNIVDGLRWLEDGVRRWREEFERARVTRNSEAAIAQSGLSLQNNVAAEVEKSKSAGVLKRRNVLMLGSGMVAGPAVEEISKRGDVQLIIATNSVTEAETLTREYTNVKYRIIDMDDVNTVSDLIREAEVIISLLPVGYHPTVAELCIRYQKHLVTASYISPAMKELHKSALKANVLLLNEIGLDPGIDHCSAISLISQLKSDRKKIVSFTSFCGGLPSPDCAHGPLKYKFSWSPKGVLLAALNGANFKLRGADWEIPERSLLTSFFHDVPISNDFMLEGLANRNSFPYAETYSLGPVPSLRTLLRGTLRYPGFARLMQSFKSIGLLETKKPIQLKHWSSLVDQSLAIQFNRNEGDKSLSSILPLILPSEDVGPLLEALVWLSLIPEASAPSLPTSSSLSTLPPLPARSAPPIDLFSALLAHKLRYQPGERDMVILSHEIIAQPSDGKGEEVYTSSLVEYGSERSSAMARCVGLPVAFAALEVLDGRVGVRGVCGPTDRSVYQAVLKGLESVGLGMKEEMRKNYDSSARVYDPIEGKRHKEQGKKGGGRFGERFKKEVVTVEDSLSCEIPV